MVLSTELSRSIQSLISIMWRMNDPVTARTLETPRVTIARVLSAVGRRWRRKIVIGFFVVVMLYGVQGCRYYLQHPNVARNYAAELNEKVAESAAQDRAWDVWQNVGICGPLEPEALYKAWPDVQPGEAVWPELVAFVKGHAAQSVQIRAGAERKVLGFYRAEMAPPHDEQLVFEEQVMPNAAENPPLIMCNGAPLNMAGPMAKLLGADMAVAVEEGDGARVEADAVGMLRIAALVPELESSLAEKISLAIVARAVDGVIDAVIDQPGIMTDGQLAGVARELSRISFASRTPAIVNAERAMAEDLVQRWWTDDGKGDGHFCGDGERAMAEMFSSQPLEYTDKALGPLALIFMPSRKEIMQRLARAADRQLQLASRPFWERREEVAEEGASGRRRNWAQDMPDGFLGESLHTDLCLITLGDMHRDRGLVAVALERYRLAHGAYPVGLGDLVPEYLAAVPRDLFDGGTLRYRLEDGVPRVWSVGSNRTDEGGVSEKHGWEAAGPGRVIGHYEADGDWVMVPPVKGWASR